MQLEKDRNQPPIAYHEPAGACPGEPCLSALRLVRSMTEAVVSQSERVLVTCYPDSRGRTLLVTVAPEDLRTLVGKQSRMAESMRTIVQSIGMRHHQRLSLRVEPVGMQPTMAEEKTLETKAG